MSKQNSGQIALIVLLVMVVVLTIGLSLVSRTVSEVRISQDEEEALRAFSAAEAGIEYYLGQGSLTAGDNQSVSLNQQGVSATVDIEEITDSYTVELDQGEIMTIIFNNTDSGSLELEWADDGKVGQDNPIASLDVTVYDDSYNTTRYAFSGDASTASNEFTTILTDPAGKYLRTIGSGTVTFVAADQIARIRVLENDTTVNVSAVGGSLPIQGYRLESRGTTEEDKTSLVAVEKTVPVLLPIFDYTLFSQGNISKT
jgi:type II secretory pathway pseudopilin PulG